MPILETMFDKKFLDGLVALAEEFEQAAPTNTEPSDYGQLPMSAPTTVGATGQPAKQQRSLVAADYALANKLLSNIAASLKAPTKQHNNNGGNQQLQQQHSTKTLPFDPEAGFVSMTKIYEFAHWMSSNADNSRFGNETSVIRQYEMKLRSIISEYNDYASNSDGFHIDLTEALSDQVEDFLALNTGKRSQEDRNKRTDPTIIDRSINAAEFASRATTVALSLLAALKSVDSDDEDQIDGQIEYGHKLNTALRRVVQYLQSEKEVH